MTNFEEKLKNISQKVSLTSDERSAIKKILLEEIEKTNAGAGISPYTNVWFFVRKHTVSVAFVAILFFGGSVSTLAEGALPGSILYPLKVGVNEEVRGWFATGERAKSEWQIALAERRLDEVEKLQEVGPLNPDTKEDIEAKIETYARRAEEASGIQINEESDANVDAGASLMMASSPVDSSQEDTSEPAPARSSISQTFKSEERLFPEEDNSVKDDAEVNIKDLRSKVQELRSRIDEAQDKTRESRSKARVMLVRARESLFKANSLLLDNKVEEVGELLRKSEENILKAEEILEEKKEMVGVIKTDQEVRGIENENINNISDDKEVVR